MVVGREMGVQMHVGFCLASISAAGEAGCWCPLWPLRLVVKDSLNPCGECSNVFPLPRGSG